MIRPTIIIPNARFNKCWPVNVIGDPDIKPLNLRNAIIDPVKVIAPMAAPKDISIKLAILILPGEPKLKTSGFKKADIATNTAAKPTKLWKPATSSGIAVIGILKAINAPIDPPIIKKINKNMNPVEKLPIEIMVTPIAMAIPIIAKKLPCRDVSGEERPLRAKIKRTPDIR